MLLVAVSLLLLAPAENEDDTLAARLQALEAQVQALQKRVDVLEAQKRAAPPSYDPPVQDKAYVFPLDGSPTLGSGNVDLVVFTDFQCPFCARVHPTLVEIATSSQLKGKVRIVYKHFPLSFHANAKPAALMSMAVRDLGGDAAFWRFVNLCFENQRALTSEDLSRYAEKSGVSAGKAERLVESNAARYEDILRADTKTAQIANVRGTPSLYVGGWQLSTRSVDGVAALIKEKGL